MRNVVIMIATIVILNGCSQQTAETDKPIQAELHLKNPKNYYFGIIESYPDKISLPDSQVQEIQKQHLANISRLADEGFLKLAGPFWLEGNKHTVRGLFLYDVVNRAKADELSSTDPAVQAKRLSVRVLPWLGSADLTYDADADMEAYQAAFFYHNKLEEIDFAKLYDLQAAYFTSSSDSGRIVMAGPFMPDSLMIGIEHSFFIYKSDTLETVEKMIATLPYIQDSSLTAYILNWYGAGKLTE